MLSPVVVRIREEEAETYLMGFFLDIRNPHISFNRLSLRGYGG